MEEKEWEEICIGASTPDEMHSIEVVAEHRTEMHEEIVVHDIEMDRTKEEV